MLKLVYLLEYSSSSGLRLLVNLQTFTFENFSGPLGPTVPPPQVEHYRIKSSLSQQPDNYLLRVTELLKVTRCSANSLVTQVSVAARGQVGFISCLGSHDFVHFFSSWGSRVLKWEWLLLDTYLLLDWKEEVSFLFCFVLISIQNQRPSFLSWMRVWDLLPFWLKNKSKIKHRVEWFGVPDSIKSLWFKRERQSNKKRKETF